MFNYTKKSLYVLTSIITLMIFCAIEYSAVELTKLREKSITTEVQTIVTKENIDILEGNIIMLRRQEIQDNRWELEIPGINMKQNISEGTSAKVLANDIGHFIETPILDGNICLASHNRGPAGAFFGKIQKLETNDIIIYRIQGVEKVYKVFLKTIVHETDFTYIENTIDDRITLVTCVENKPELRCIVQGIRKEEI